MVFYVSPVVADDDGGWCVTCDDVSGEGDNVAIECGPVGVGEGEFIYAPEDSDVARWFFDDEEEGRTLLLR